MAWKVLRTLKDSIKVQEQDPRPRGTNDKKYIYNPYKKKYEVRTPTQRKNKKEELKLTLLHQEYPSDVLWVGDQMNVDREPGTLRIWAQNWNGAEKYSEDKIMYQLSTLCDNNINYFSIIESRLNQYSKAANDKWRKASQRIMPQGEILITSSPGFPITEAHQPGGIISGFHGPLQSRYNKSFRDPMGRWHYDQFYGKTRNLRIYTLYRINPGSDEQQGETTAWSQQRKLLDNLNDDRNPRKAVTEDFLKEIHDAVTKKFSIIILADLNETVDGVEKTNYNLRAMGLLNVMEERIGPESLPRTCNKSNRAIDHIWVTGNILNAIHRAGFAPFDFIKSSDHRGLFFDFSYKNILDENLHKLEPPKRKRLQSSIPNRVEKYIDVVQDQWEYHKISERFQALNNTREVFTDEHVRQLNILDKQITDIMVCAERKCSFVPAHSIGAWSVKLKNALRDLMESATKRTRAKRIKLGANIQKAIEKFKEADKKWKEAKTAYKDVKKNAKKLRNDHIYECAEASAERKGNVTIDAEIKRLKTIEEQRRKAARMAFAMKPFTPAGSTTLLIPAVSAYSTEERSQPGFDHFDINTMWNRIYPHNGKDIHHWERIDDKTLVQRLTLHWQRKHFTQAAETPLGSTKWNDELLKKEVQEKILNGNYTVEDDSPIEIQELFDQMKRPTVVENEIQYTSSIDEFISFIKGSSEKKSTSPSGRGYNHYKSLLIGNGREQLEVIHGILELARRHNIILHRWKHTVTTLMEKDVGSPKIHRMRSIHIIEAEVQYIAKLFYCKKLLLNAERLDLITDQQYGGRNRKQAQSVVLNKLMYYQISHQQLTEAAFMDDDARNCYDRILTALSAVELRSWGHSYEESQFCTNFLQSQEYYVRTGLGITEKYYKYSREDPTHGSGQGIGWAGVKFTRTSDSICKIMAKTCAGMQFKTPDGKIEVKRNGDIFVDDTALGATANCSTYTNILHQLQHDQQKHAYLLYAGGHKLALDKCSYYLVRFIREGMEQRHCLNHEVEGSLKIREGYGKDLKEIKRLQPFECHRTLGHYISITNNQKRQKREMMKKITLWCDRLRTSYLSGEDTIYAYTGYLETSLKYMISSGSLSFKECDEMSKKIEGILLNAFSIQKNCSRFVLFAPTSLGGLGITHIYHMQGLEKLKFMLMHLKRDDVTGKLLRICMAWTQLEAGTRNHFFQEDHSLTKNWITPTWITHLWEYMQHCNCELCLNRHNTQTPRINDFYLMDVIKNCPVSTENKRIFNQIRLALKLETASDLVYLSSGTEICKSILDGKNYRDSKKGWPKILPYPVGWNKTWKTLLRDFIQPKLQSRPLGRWMRKGHQVWKAHTNPDGNYLVYENVTYKKHGYTSLMIPVHETIHCDIEADISLSEIGIKLESSCIRTIAPIPTILTTPQWMHRNFGTFYFDDHTVQKIIRELSHDNIIAASDGSVLHGQAAHAYCLATKDTHEVFFLHAAPVDGDPNLMTSFRPEAFGAMAVITLLNMLSKQNNITSATIPIYIDNSETIQVLEGKKNLSTMSSVISDHIDIATQLHFEKINSNLSYAPIHVKSHIEDTGQELRPEHILNQIVDTHVGEFVRDPPPRLCPLEIPPTLPAQQMTILQSGNPLEANIASTIITSFMYDDVEDFYKKHHQISPTSMPSIDFDSIHRVLAGNTKKLGKRVKNINYQWNTMATCKKWGKATVDLCPICGKATETWQHIHKCQDSNMMRKNKENIEKIKKRMTKLKTLPALQTIFLDLLSTTTFDAIALSPEILASPHADVIQKAYKDQLHIGLQAFYKGFISKQWIDIQRRYYYTTIKDSKYNIMRWKKAIVSLIIDRGNELWEERCTLMHLNKQGTEEARYRTYLFDICIAQKEQKNLNIRDLHLLKRRKKYFLTAHMSVLEMWHSRLLGALERERERRKTEGDDISKFVTRKRRKRRRRLPIVDASPPPKSFKQTTLWPTVIHNSVPQSAPAPPSNLVNHLSQLLTRRIKRKRQSRIFSTQQTSPNTTNTINNEKRQKNYESHRTRVKRKRSSSQTTYVRIKDRKTIRERIRITGNETKNNR